jgi:ribulose-phosphate 3-epimerase
MDGRFVLLLVLDHAVSFFRKATTKVCDVHLMIEERKICRALSGADVLSVHVEACPHLHRNIQQIKLGMKAGVAINPYTPLIACMMFLQISILFV